MKYDCQYQQGVRSFETDFGRVIEPTDGGYERGYAIGYEEGYAAGHGIGDSEGYSRGYGVGHDIGRREGYDAGYAAGYDVGYNAGYEKGRADGIAEIESANTAILTDCNAVLPTKGVETAETLEQVPQRIGEIQSYDDGYDAGVEDGKEAEYDRFWDTYQENGAKINYENAFSGHGWTDETFKPKYSITTNNAYMLFRATSVKDIAKCLGDKTITFTTPQFSYTFNQARYLETIPLNIVFAWDITSADGTFGNCVSLRVIEPILPCKDVSLNSTFSGCSLLEEVRFSGTIAKQANFSTNAALSSESVQSIIDHLKDLTGQTAQTLTLHATVGAKLTEEQKAAITAKNWTLVY